eukprot:6125425-Amphidinium_carterae.1
MIGHEDVPRFLEVLDALEGQDAEDGADADISLILTAPDPALWRELQDKLLHYSTLRSHSFAPDAPSIVQPRAQARRSTTRT